MRLVGLRGLFPPFLFFLSSFLLFLGYFSWYCSQCSLEYWAVLVTLPDLVNVTVEEEGRALLNF